MKFLQTLKAKARKLKSEAQVLMVVYKNPATPFIAKLLIAITVGYLLSPIDLIPDFIPVLGWLDDIIIVPLLIKMSLRSIPKNVLEEARKKVSENPQQYKKSNWLFAIIIIAIWVVGFYVIYKAIKNYN